MRPPPTRNDAQGCVTLNGTEVSVPCGSSPWILIAADPVLALVLALHVAAARGDGVALDRLALEGVALGGPVLERAGLEVEVERLAVVADRQDALRRFRLRIGPRSKDGEQCEQRSESGEATHVDPQESRSGSCVYLRRRKAGVNRNGRRVTAKSVHH